MPTEGRPATGCPPPHIVSYAQKIVSTGRPGVVAAPSELDTSYRGLFRVPGLSTLITATLAGRIATQMSSVLIVLYVLETAHSPQLSGLVILCSQFPGILVSPIAGALLDRCPKIPLMVIDYLVGSAAVFAIGALALADALPAPLLLAIVSLASLTQPLSRVGGRAIFPVMVPRPLWDRSNAVDSGCFVIATVLGPAVAGVAVASIGARAPRCSSRRGCCSSGRSACCGCRPRPSSPSSGRAACSRTPWRRSVTSSRTVYCGCSPER